MIEREIGTVTSRICSAREQIAARLGAQADAFCADRVTMSVLNGTGLAATSRPACQA